MENHMESAEEKYHKLFELESDAIFVIDNESGNILEVNEAACELYGFSRDELLTMRHTDLSAEPEETRRVTLAGKTYIPVRWHRRRDQTVFPVEITANHFNWQGRLVHISAIRDNTERMRATEALRESENRFRSLFDRSFDCVYIIDFQGRVIDANMATIQLFGYSKADFASLKVESFIHPEQFDILKKRRKELIKTGFQTTLHEYKIRRMDGAYLDMETMSSIIYRDGKPHAIMGVARDVTQRKQTEAFRQQSLERVRQALGATIQAMALAVEARDPYTAGHQTRVADLARTIATEMNLSAVQIDALRMASKIHDLGKIAIPSDILSKPTKLTDIELSLVKTHSQIGYDILKDIEFPWPVAKIILDHHERMDGSGYPNGITHENILIESKILMIADVVDAISSHRPYRPGLGIDVALNEIEENKGRLYDAETVDVCLRLFSEKGYTMFHQEGPFQLDENDRNTI